MTKQTAVEWLIEYCDRENWSIPNNIIAKAKEMEKQQIKDAYESLEHRHGENYYNETFKSVR